MQKIKTFFYILFFLSLKIYSQVEYKFDNSSEFPIYNEKNPGMNYLKQSKATEKEKSILFFGGFSEIDSVKVSNKEKILFNKNLWYSPQTGLSGVIIFDNNNNLKIEFFKETKVKINLQSGDLKKYKHVYITKKDEKYIVEFSNRLKFFG
ncbi:hypothetical protein LZZ90_10880 [Flavobacterium sp. SM15]|uniref:hypothetical protein n=1 Tax=Flavobacterium sp. SM15 TaxID=2908005 RepID=UPI001EDABB61|nr:hypothetical protein [Flavobacterium sp. SM15]MCG2612011.1 hypothetical protein [Flavobacterium sp. SM15]